MKNFSIKKRLGYLCLCEQILSLTFPSILSCSLFSFLLWLELEDWGDHKLLGTPLETSFGLMGSESETVWAKLDLIMGGVRDFPKAQLCSTISQTHNRVCCSGANTYSQHRAILKSQPLLNEFDFSQSSSFHSIECAARAPLHNVLSAENQKGINTVQRCFIYFVQQ